MEELLLLLTIGEWLSARAEAARQPLATMSREELINKAMAVRTILQDMMEQNDPMLESRAAVVCFSLLGDILFALAYPALPAALQLPTLTLLPMVFPRGSP